MKSVVRINGTVAALNMMIAIMGYMLGGMSDQRMGYSLGAAVFFMLTAVLFELMLIQRSLETNRTTVVNNVVNANESNALRLSHRR